MARDYSSVPEKDLAAGINQQAAEDSIPPGYVEHALNVDFNSEGLVEKRVGFRNYLGNLPLRVAQVEHVSNSPEPDTLIFRLTSTEHPNLDIDLSNVAPSPILVVGKTANNIPDFGTTYNSLTGVPVPTAQYYPTFVANPRKKIVANSLYAITPQPVAFPQAEHGNTTYDLFIGTTESKSQTNKNNDHFYAFGTEINKANLNVTVFHQNTTETFDAFFYALNASESGTGYAQTYTAVTSVNILATEHNLNTFNIMCRTYEDTGSILKEILPDVVEVNENTGTVSITFSETGNYRVVLYAAPIFQQFSDSIVSGALSSSTQGQFEIPNLLGDFIFLDCFVGDGAGTWTKIMAEEVQIDTLANSALVSFTNAASGAFLKFVWEYAKVKTNALVVTAHVTGVSATDIQPELSLYGLVAEEIFPAKEAPRSGWIQHIDTYKSEGFSTVVAGLGWNLFQAVENQQAPSYLHADTFYPSLRARSRSSVVLAPVFSETLIGPGSLERTRGGLTFDGGASGWATLENIIWNESDDGYWVTLLTPNLQEIGAPIIKPFTETERFGDLLSIKGAELRSFDGDWPIWDFDTSTPNKTKLLIKTTFSSADYDCLNSGEAGIFTDAFPVDHRPLLTRGDTLTAQSFPQGVLLSYIGTDREANPNLYIANVTEEIQLANGQLVIFSRENKYCYGPRTADGVQRSFVLADNQNIAVVRGDSLVISGRLEPVEVSFLVGQELTGITASISDEVLTLQNVAFGPSPEQAAARLFSVGQKLLLQDLGYDALEFEITEIGSDNKTLYLAAPNIANLTELLDCTILPQLQLREITNLTDNTFNTTTLTIEGRWEAIEKPQIDEDNTTIYNAVDARMTEHFKADEYGTQSVLRSTMSQNNLYLTNGKDPVMKFDGFNIYRAGVPRWNPQLFVRKQAGGGITPAGLARYYFRLGGFDANGNFVVGATTGVQDYLVDIPASHNIHLRLVGFPVWDNYDFEKLVVQIYRTKVFEDIPGTGGSPATPATPIAPFYLVGELEMPQTMGGGYVDFVDSETNSTIGGLSKDGNIIATAGDYLSATTLSEPLRAKYMTSLNNRIVLANIRGYQQISLRINKPNAAITFADVVGKTFTLFKNYADTTSSGTENKLTIEYVNKHAHVDIANIATAFAGANLTLKLSDTGDADFPAPWPVAGDWVYLTHITSETHDVGEIKGVGWFQIISADEIAETITIYAPGEGTDKTKLACDSAIFATSPGQVPVYLATDRCFLQQSANDDNILTITFRTAAAINSVMRQVNTTLGTQSTFKPWIMADAGGEFDRGVIRFRRPVDAVPFRFSAAGWNGISFIYNGLQYSEDVVIDSQASVFPSRVIYSYQNFPELFNKPDQRLITLADSDSHLPVDVNSADGQEITGIIPFFGESAFGQATRESLLVVFKTNSIYLVDLRSDSLGNVLGEVQKIESQGLGCTAPYSIAPTKDGIMFANESGIYKLTRQLTVEPIGQFVDRIWREEVDLGQLSLAQGHHFGVGRQYKLSVPLQDATNNTDVLVYEHTRESRGQAGAWGRYDNHEVTGWANLLNNEFFGTTHARVCTRRSSASKWDYSDRGTAIVATVDLRPNDLGIPNTRKRLLHVSVHFRNPQENTLNISQQSTTVGLATDLKEDFLPCDKYESGGLFSKTGISDLGLLKGETIRFSAPTSKAIQYQVKIENAGLYETLQFSGVTYRVSAMSTKGTKEADDTTKK